MTPGKAVLGASVEIVKILVIFLVILLLCTLSKMWFGSELYVLGGFLALFALLKYVELRSKKEEAKE